MKNEQVKDEFDFESCPIEVSMRFSKYTDLMEDLRVLDIIANHLSICKPIDASEGKEVDFEVFDIDLWGTGKQQDDFKIVKDWLEKRNKEEK